MVSFALFTLFLLKLVVEYGDSITTSPDFRLGVITEECFDKRQLFFEKFRYIQNKTNVTVTTTPCRDLKIAKAQLCLLLRDGVTFFIALATHPVLGFYQVVFDTLATPINPNIEQKNEITNIVGKVIVEVTRVWQWQNLFMFVDGIFGDVVPRCTPRIAKHRSCHLAMVWTTENSIEEFLNRTLEYATNSVELQKSKIHCVIALTHQHTIAFIQEANKRNMFNDYFEWLVLHPGTHQVLENFSVLTYDSNVFLMRLKSRETLIRDILDVRQTFKNQSATTWQLVQPGRVKEICNIEVAIPLVENDTETDLDDFLFEVNEIVPSRLNQTPALRPLGEWTHSAGYKYLNSRALPNFEGAQLKVVTTETPPFMFVEQKNGTADYFSGYLVDLLKITAKRLNFSYELYSVPDKEFGAQINNSYWTGMIGAVQREEADLALANLTPLKERAEAVHFLTATFADGGFKLYYRKPSVQEESFRFGRYLRPFHYLTWFSASVLLLVMSFVLSVAYELNAFLFRKNAIEQQPQDEFRMRNFLFIAALIVAQRSVMYTPSRASGRVIFLVIWFFIYVLFVSYSANLTSYFTASEQILPIKDLDEALSQSEYIIGLTLGTSYLTMIRNDSVSPEYAGLNKLFSKDPTTLVRTIDEGFRRAATEKFVFIHDRGTLRWKASESCDFVVVGPTYMRDSVTLATSHGSPYYKGFNWALQALQECGILKRYHDHWLKGDTRCNFQSNKFKRVSIFTMTGPFLFLSTGLAAAVAVVIVENLQSLHREQRISEARLEVKTSLQSSAIARKKLFELPVCVSFRLKRKLFAKRAICTARHPPSKKN